MNNEKKRILQMLSDKKISTEEALSLLEALDIDETTENPKMKDTRGRKNKNLRVDINANDEAKVKVNLPLSLVKALLPLAKSSVMPDKVHKKLEEKGLNLNQLIELADKVTDELFEQCEEIIDINVGDGGEDVTVKAYVD